MTSLTDPLTFLLLSLLLSLPSLLSTQPGAAKPPKGIASLVLVGMTCLLCMFGYHATYVSSIAYSSPSIVIDAGRMPDGRRVLYDDYREAYYWLRQVSEKTTAWRQTEQPVSQSRASTLTPSPRGRPACGRTPTRTPRSFRGGTTATRCRPWPTAPSSSTTTPGTTRTSPRSVARLTTARPAQSSMSTDLTGRQCPSP